MKSQFNLHIDIKCRKTNVLLGTLTPYLVEGGIPFVKHVEETAFLHPFFGLSDGDLLKRLHKEIVAQIDNETSAFPVDIESAQEDGERKKEDKLLKLKILMAVTLDRLKCLVIHQYQIPTLPDSSIAVGSAGRLLTLANWYLFNTSRRMPLPKYCPCKDTASERWQNFRIYLDSCYAVVDQWENEVRRKENEAIKIQQEKALKEISFEDNHYRRADRNKIWRWIEAQLEMEVHPNILKRYKLIFLSANLMPEEWDTDDIEDFIYDLFTHCDTETSVYHWIHNQLIATKEFISDFYNSFNLLPSSASSVSGENSGPNKILEEIKESTGQLETLPPPPKEKDYKVRALYLRDRARWELIKAQWDAQQKKDTDSNKGSEQ